MEDEGKSHPQCSERSFIGLGIGGQPVAFDVCPHHGEEKRPTERRHTLRRGLHRRPLHNEKAY